jgi:hypothetical protein
MFMKRSLWIHTKIDEQTSRWQHDRTNQNSGNVKLFGFFHKCTINILIHLTFNNYFKSLVLKTR